MVRNNHHCLTLAHSLFATTGIPLALQRRIIRRRLRLALLPDAIRNLYQIRPLVRALAGIDNDSARVSLVEQVKDGLAVRLKRCLGRPDDADGVVGLLHKQAEAGGDTRAGGDDDAGLKETGNAHDAELRGATRVDLLGRVADDLLGPVASVGDDDREAAVASVGEAGGGGGFRLGRLEELGLDFRDRNLGAAAVAELLKHAAAGGGQGRAGGGGRKSRAHHGFRLVAVAVTAGAVGHGLGCGRVGDDAKGMCLTERGISKADGLAIVDIAVVEVELHAMF